MKLKVLLLVLAGFVGSITAMAKDTYSTSVSVLPENARTTLTTHFPKKGVNHIKIDQNVLGTEGYDVILNDGTEVEFDGKGNLKEVDCGVKGQVPNSLIMKSILNYVKTNYPKQRIIKYEVKRTGYEVELQSGLDLEFNQQGVFKRIDH